MKTLEEKILKEGKILPGNIVKVGDFLNQQMDVPFLMEMGREVAEKFRGETITKVLTVESSGIAIAVAVASAMGTKAVFAKKGLSSNVSGDVYSADVYSYTHQKNNTIFVSCDYITKDDRVLIVDDFLAVGNAVAGLEKIVHDAGATLVGVAAAIEKGFQGGGDALRNRGIHVESLAIVESIGDGTIQFRK